jgi:ABC-type iron transport system FetAB permease component|tara:strand:- start:23488 stop:23739 length:252 start_codon:yes stop_codon:yes gene_type:complete
MIWLWFGCGLLTVIEIFIMDRKKLYPYKDLVISDVLVGVVILLLGWVSLIIFNIMLILFWIFFLCISFDEIDFKKIIILKKKD